MLIGHAAVVIVGAVCLGVSLVLAENASGGTAEQLAWAADAYALWLRMGGIFTAAAGGVILLASLIRHKMVKIRALAACAASLMLLFFGGCYGVICIGEAVDPSGWVWLCAAGYAGLMHLGGAVDAAFAIFAGGKSTS